MSFIKGEGFACDLCDTLLQARTFEEGREKMHNEGWISVKHDGDWLHYCDTCNEELYEHRL